MQHDGLIAEARAKITWGEPASSVHEYLTSNGVPGAEADTLIRQLEMERSGEVRQRGIRDLIIGMVLVGGAGSLLFLMLDGSLSRLPIRSAKIFGILGLVALYGLWRLINGIIRLMHPRSEQGSISDVAD